ncbi:MAG: hypothetical protein QF908_06100, partial [Dehalococcoidia bacterium]|nr:hypothetical protein [Dehalococcoidia bacterium]
MNDARITSNISIVSYLAKIWWVLRKWPVIPIIILLTLLICSGFSEQIAPESYRKTDLRLRNAPPFWMEGGS